MNSNDKCKLIEDFEHKIEFTFHLSSHGIFTQTDYIRSIKESLNNIQKIEIIQVYSLTTVKLR